MKFVLLILFSTFSFISSFSQNPLIENKKWELEKFRDSKSRRMIFVDEYHYLEFRERRVRYSIDCNKCSSPYEFVTKDTILFEGPPMCTRKGCLEKDEFQITFDGQYKIWQKGMYLVIQKDKEVYYYK